ncbi:MAG: nucleotidyl transferase AbiEii/AbiGii toxin family protein [Acidobacteria bacterium]|nr:nucleotidyl transferase AbiEii/AbiGii toxin family protein [Acidobacteriota bacterium]
MKISRERLLRESAVSGFRPEILEKVFHLLTLLEGFNRHPFLKDRVALKGGTAINLFVLDLPRLSVDIDLNYIGSATLESMRTDKPKIEEALTDVCAREGIIVARSTIEHAGSRFALRYESVLGGGGNLKLDVNYMFRTPLWPVRRMDSHSLGTIRATAIPVLDLHELAAGKLAALLARHASRDIFDAHQLLKTQNFDTARLRVAFVAYGALNRKDWRTVTPAHVRFTDRELRNELIPVLRQDHVEALPQSVQEMVAEVRADLQVVLPLSEAELQFLTGLLDQGEIDPALIVSDHELADTIRIHPGLLWKAGSVRRHKTRSSP